MMYVVHNISHLPPGELAESGESHCDGGVDVTTGHLRAEEKTKDGPDTPAEETILDASSVHASYTYPQLMEKKSPFKPRERTL